MTSHTHDDTAAKLTIDSDDNPTVETTVTLDGEEYPLTVREPTLGQLRELREELATGEMDDGDLIDEWVAAPRPVIDNLRPRYVGRVASAVMAAWGGGEAMEAAMAEVETEGN